MAEDSETFRGKAREHNEAFEEAMEQGDDPAAAFEARDALAVNRKAEELYRLEHPEVERLDRINKSLDALTGIVNAAVPWLIAITALLGVIAYKLW